MTHTHTLTQAAVDKNSLASSVRVVAQWKLVLGETSETRKSLFVVELRLARACQPRFGRSPKFACDLAGGIGRERRVAHKRPGGAPRSTLRAERH